MNIFISADIEGMAGIVGWHQANNDERDYGTARLWMTEQVNAAVEGAISAGATGVLVKDAHETATNILLDKLHPAAELISGWGPLGSMVEGVDESFDAVMLLGYHARAMTPGGTLAHTWSGNVLDLRLNGEPIGEAAWAAAFAGQFNVPIALVTGDDKLKEQLDHELPPGFHYVITKTGMGHKAARLRPLKDVCDEIRETAAASLADLEGLPVFMPHLPVTVSMRFRHWEGLDICAAVPGVQRLDVATFQFRAADMTEAQKYFVTLHRLAPRPA
jgi:D-amino peptidase